MLLNSLKKEAFLKINHLEFLTQTRVYIFQIDNCTGGNLYQLKDNGGKDAVLGHKKKVSVVPDGDVRTIVDELRLDELVSPLDCDGEMR